MSEKFEKYFKKWVEVTQKSGFKQPDDIYEFIQREENQTAFDCLSQTADEYLKYYVQGYYSEADNPDYPTELMEKVSFLPLLKGKEVDGELRKELDRILEEALYLGIINHLAYFNYESRGNVKKLFKGKNKNALKAETFLLKWAAQSSNITHWYKKLKKTNRKILIIALNVYKGYGRQVVKPFLAKELKIGFFKRAPLEKRFFHLFLTGSWLVYLGDVAAHEQEKK